MLDQYYRYLYYIMGWSYGLHRKSKKKGMQIYKYDGVKVVFLNDYKNRRLLVFYFKESTKELWRQSLHFFYVRPIRKLVTETVKKIQEDDSYFEELKKRRSISYKKIAAYRKYKNYQYKLSKK